MRALLTVSLLAFSTVALANSYEDQAKRVLLSDPSFWQYVRQNEAQRNVKWVGVRATNDVKPPEAVFWRIDFEGQQRGRRLICMGCAQSTDTSVSVNLDLPIDCRIEL